MPVVFKFINRKRQVFIPRENRSLPARTKHMYARVRWGDTRDGTPVIDIKPFFPAIYGMTG